MTPTDLITAALHEQHHPRTAAAFAEHGPQTVEGRAMFAVIERLVEALNKYDDAVSPCPFTRRRTPPADKPCPTCRATSSEGCGLQTVAANTFMRSARAALKGASHDNG